MTPGNGRVDEIIRGFDRAAAEYRQWDDLATPTVANLARKFLSAPWHYPLSQLAKVRPIRVTGRTTWGAEMRGYLPDYFHLVRSGILGSQAEVRLGKYLARHLGPDTVFLDVGAGCGFYSLLADYVIGSHTPCIHAFEPTPWVFGLLEENARRTRSIVANSCAVADCAGTATLYMHPKVPVANTIMNGDGATETREVPVVTIDEYCGQHHVVPTLLKIDVEGAEDRVVAGAQQTLRDTHPIVAMEMFLDNNTPHRAAAEKLLCFGYRPHAINADGGLDPMGLDPMGLDPDDLKRLVGGPQRYANLVFTSDRH